jgi:predicted nucleic acid-binding protein
MNAGRAFFDTSVLLYLISADEKKAEVMEKLLVTGGVLSVQVLSEFTSVAIRKLGMTWKEVAETLGTIRELCHVEALTEQAYDLACELADRYDLSWYDAMIASSAALAECDVLYAEDMHHGLRIGRRLRIVNPFMARTSSR